jgi:hypothetical protein
VVLQYRKGFSTGDKVVFLAQAYKLLYQGPGCLGLFFGSAHTLVYEQISAKANQRGFSPTGEAI